MIRRRPLLAFAALAAFTQSGRAALDASSFLVIRGSIRRFTDPTAKVYRFSEQEFMSLPQSTITTATPWMPRSKFDGPLLSSVLAHVGADGSFLNVDALDDYSARIPMSDLELYGPILAHSCNGRRMTARDHGPLFVMYPRDRYRDKLSTPPAQARFVWQVRRISVV